MSIDEFIAEALGFILAVFAVLMTIGGLLNGVSKKAPAPAAARKKDPSPGVHRRKKKTHTPQVHEETPPVEVTRIKPEPKRVRGREMIIHHEILSPPLALRNK